MATGTIQQIEMLDYINEQPRPGQERSRDTNQTERRLTQLLFLSFGVLCVIQAILNISLRLALYSGKESSPLDCNTTHISDQKKEVEMNCERKRPGYHCNRLQERFNALTRDRDMLENRNNELNNEKKDLEEERDRLKMMLRGLNKSSLRILTSGQSDGASSQKCPADWREINSRCYFLSSEQKTWGESRKYCQRNGSDLVVIDSEQEQAALYRLDGNTDLLFWIGLYNTNGIFKWVDGSALTKSFWQDGQPGDGGPNREDCVEMYHFNPLKANWNDAPCGQKRRWLCETDQNTSS
ncbi:asialoglycoprotein receptor 1-like isoform X1 [Seriola aureovittata]|uniref:asialoglycoprotein receptor 1-like isoform X1 n=1 Tax=Seriola aureovittata TaxID=2871759 RepID=UPI0024BDBFA4|nr:asialoglycoprotein receptor 1-like isoform X1 [Seriola aureovittata]